MTWRIREQAVFARFRSEGRHCRFGPLWCSFIPDAAAVPPRVGYAIGRPIGDAVTRNRLRRRLRGLMAAEAAQTAGGLPGGWYLVGATPAAVVLDADGLAIAVGGLLAQVRS